MPTVVDENVWKVPELVPVGDPQPHVIVLVEEAFIVSADFVNRGPAHHDGWCRKKIAANQPIEDLPFGDVR